MGCQCCRMIKSSIYDPSVAVDVRKTDSAGSSLYQTRQPSGGPPGGDHHKQKQGFHNLGYSKSNESTLKLEVDNNHVNRRLHAPLASGKDTAPLAGGPYIIQPETWGVRQRAPGQVPVYPNIQEYNGGEGGRQAAWDRPVTGYGSADETDEGVGGTPEYLCDTGDEGSVLSVDIHTSTTSLSSAETRDELGRPKAPDASTVESGISVARSEDQGGAASAEEEEQEEARSVTDSMVAEALAALEAATAGEDCE